MLTLARAAGPEYEWIHVTDAPGLASRDGAGALVYEGRMWLLGGWNSSDKEGFPRVCSNEVRSSTDGRTWTLVKPNTFRDGVFDPAKDWEGRHTNGQVVFRNRMWIVGGDPIQGHYQSDVWSSAEGKTWECASAGQPVPWPARVLHHVVVFKDRIWVMGGQTLPPFAPGPERFYRDIWSTRDGVHWEEMKPNEPYWSARGMIGGSVVFKGRLWILGGGLYETPGVRERRSYNDVWSSADGRDWTCHLPAAPWSPRTYHSVAVFDDRMWVLAGFLDRSDGKSGNRNDVWYSSDGINWQELPGTPWKARHAASVFVYDNALWVMCGSHLQTDVWKLVRRDPVAP